MRHFALLILAFGDMRPELLRSRTVTSGAACAIRLPAFAGMAQQKKSLLFLQDNFITRILHLLLSFLLLARTATATAMV